jgi:hypothetical protein
MSTTLRKDLGKAGAYISKETPDHLYADLYALLTDCATVQGGFAALHADIDALATKYNAAKADMVAISDTFTVTEAAIADVIDGTYGLVGEGNAINNAKAILNKVKATITAIAAVTPTITEYTHTVADVGALTLVAESSDNPVTPLVLRKDLGSGGSFISQEHPNNLYAILKACLNDLTNVKTFIAAAHIDIAALQTRLAAAKVDIDAIVGAVAAPSAGDVTDTADDTYSSGVEGAAMELEEALANELKADLNAIAALAPTATVMTKTSAATTASVVIE